ncbi:AttF component of AttEFGH ABC transport system / AttG component of AttEFGH ABC transport system [Georgfuchsia toluolica]|uniref:AttF component of AttEFGH ABC transport system / AttG component of AttEFGH ABC transport system n=2 Tax=Georgfuchsia toluolica TaxID=424218 RepID=A0A916N8N6_9PROT|nr:AttF component of AttEFGH ABC transport system / AttG component of AttEFGH ABC transport system [Georgfuchsia toluolica]
MATLFSFVAVVLGVALGMAVQTVHEAALTEFDRGLRSMTGMADLQVVGPRGGFDEMLYGVIAGHPAVAAASPVLEVEAKRAGTEETLQLLGVDILALARVTPALLPRPAGKAGRLATLSNDNVFVSAAALSALGLKTGDSIRLQVGVRSVGFRIAGDIPGETKNRRLALMDIAAVQSHFGKLGRITRIDLRLAAGVATKQVRSELQALLPAGVLIETPQAALDQAANLSRAYRVNLTLLAAIALLTGGFLVFSAQALSVLRRRTEFAFLRTLGLARRSLFAWLVGEGAVIGFAGGVMGAVLGYGLAWIALILFGGDLGAGYFSGLRPSLQFQPQVMAIYVGLGTLAGIAGAWLPARDAATVSPAQALKAGDEAALPGKRRHPWLGLTLLAASSAACAIPPMNGLPLGGYLAVAFLLAGSILLLPLLAAAITRCLPSRGPVPARLAAARLGAAPGHALAAASGVLVSVALAVAMAIMVTSFRDSVDQWLTQLLPADLYVRTGRTQSSGFLDETVQARILAVERVRRVSFSRYDSLRLGSGNAPVALIARPLPGDGSSLPLVGAALPVSPPAIWISEAMVDIYGWRTGQQVALPLAGRRVDVHVAGVWRDYARQTGAVMMDLADYRRLTGDSLVNDAAIYLAPDAAYDQVVEALAAMAGPGVLDIARPGEIRANSLALFDRSFAVTYLLETIAVVIGLAGVATSFAALAAARRHEFGMLRHLGLTRRQIGWMLAQEGALAAGVGVIAGLLAGGAIGLVLIEVVNRQSFHWSMDLHVPWVPLALFATCLVLLAAMVAVLAGGQAMRHDAVMAVREDW